MLHLRFDKLEQLFESLASVEQTNQSVGIEPNRFSRLHQPFNGCVNRKFVSLMQT